MSPDQMKVRQEMKEEELRERERLTNLSAAQQQHQQHDLDPDYVQQMVETDLQDGTAQMLSNMLSRDWVLSNLSEPEVHEIRWLARTFVDELEAAHPSEESIWTGELREYASGDDTQRLRPLTEAQKLEITQLVQGFIARVARSKDGFQQEIFRKQISKTESEDRSGAEDSGWI
jgi:hypothetical protein